MLRKLLVVSLAVLTLSSCKKDKTESKTYHLTAKIDGVKIDFSSSLAAEKYLDPQNGYTLSVLGIGGNTSVALPALDLMIHDDTEITTKTYNPSQHSAYSTYNDVDFETYDSNTEFSITITSITATEVRGTFTGKFVHSGPGNIVNVSEGSFYSRLF